VHRFDQVTLGLANRNRRQLFVPDAGFAHHSVNCEPEPTDNLLWANPFAFGIESFAANEFFGGLYCVDSAARS
jgi:hypothetical protein